MATKKTAKASKKTPKPKKTKRAAPKKAASKPFDLTATLAEASWAEADHALAEAITELEALEQAMIGLRRADIARTEGPLLLVRQALSRAARKRGFRRFGDSGAAEAYDPRLHQLQRQGRTVPKAVKIVRAGVARGELVLIKAEAAPSRARPRGASA